MRAFFSLLAVRARILAFPFAFITAIALSVASLGRFSGPPDDLFILLVYVRHFIAGQGIYFNREDGPLDAFTSFGDFIVKSAAGAMLPHDLVFAAFFTALFFFVAALGLVFFVLRPQKERLSWKIICIAAVIAAGTAEPFGSGATFLLETPLYVFFGTLAIAAYRGEQNEQILPRCIWLFALVALALTRPEGLLVSGTWLTLDYFFAVAADRKRATLFAAVLFLSLMAVYALWHLQNFGYLAPNSYYAKTSDTRMNEVYDGLDYAKNYLTSEDGALFAVALLLAPLLAVPRFWQNAFEWKRFCLLIAGAWASVFATIVSGGDSYRGFRFFALPAVLLVLAFSIAALHLNGTRRIAPRLMLLSLIGFQIFVVAESVPAEFAALRRWPYHDLDFKCDLAVAATLRKIDSNIFVAQGDYQKLKYFSDSVRLLDLAGLTDRQIAHSHVTGHVFWGKFSSGFPIAAQRRVDLWKLSSTMDAVPASNYSMRELLSKPADPGAHLPHFAIEKRFMPLIAKEYVPASFPVCGSNFNFLLKRDLAPRAAAAGMAIGKTE